MAKNSAGPGLDIFAMSSQVELEKLAKLENTKEKQTAKA